VLEVRGDPFFGRFPVPLWWRRGRLDLPWRQVALLRLTIDFGSLARVGVSFGLAAHDVRCGCGGETMEDAVVVSRVVAEALEREGEVFVP
jgi:hypothetical protein